MNLPAFRQAYKKRQLWRLTGKMVVCRKTGHQEKNRGGENNKNIKPASAVY